MWSHLTCEPFLTPCFVYPFARFPLSYWHHTSKINSETQWWALFALVATLGIVLRCELVLTCGIFNRLATWSFGSFSASMGSQCVFSCITMMWWTGSRRQNKLSADPFVFRSSIINGIWKEIICVHSTELHLFW